MMRDPASVLEWQAGERVGTAAGERAAHTDSEYADGVRALVAMREGILTRRGHASVPVLADEDIRRVLETLFSPEILELRAIDWASPSAVLDRIVRYEAVHDITDRDELRRRLQPADRRCFGLFHPAMPDDPVIFTEIALTSGPVASIDEILAPERAPIRAEAATTAIFYSISGSQPGLRGITFGSLLIARAAAELRRALPQLDDFLTLSPLPGFRSWISDLVDSGEAPVHLRALSRSLEDSALGSEAPAQDDELRRAAEAYLLHTRLADGRPVDSVARFHLGNGATLDRVHVRADTSARGLRESFGVMASYRYERQAQ